MYIFILYYNEQIIIGGNICIIFGIIYDRYIIFDNAFLFCYANNKGERS